MEFKIYPFHSFDNYFSADVMAIYEGKWIFCMHKNRTTWEHPSGWIEAGETPLEAAKRELFEETGAIEFDIEPLCDYYIDGELNGYQYKGNGQVYFAIVHKLSEIPDYSEMGKIGLFEDLPDELTYPILREYFPIAMKRRERGETMQNDNTYEFVKIRDNIWQIAEDDGVYCTLIKGKEKAVLIDTGYGRRDLKSFIEEYVSTPYMVINSHGHPDHIGGNHWFDEVWALREEWDVIKHFEEREASYQLKELRIGEQINLGDIHINVISLAGHTKGSIGFIVLEEKLLVAGDALNEGLWLFNYGALSMEKLYETLKQTMKLDFNTYLCGHSDKEYEKRKILAHIRNIENLKVDESTKQNTIGFETYHSIYEDSDGKSEIVFTSEVITRELEK